MNFISGGREASYDSFLTDIMACGPEDCRYGLFDFEIRSEKEESCSEEAGLRSG